MKTEVVVGPFVKQFVKSLAPKPRRALTRAIKGLAKGEGDTKALEGKLSGWHRLRVSGYRVLYKESATGVRFINCVFANYRSVVYEMFAQLLADQLVP